MTHESTVEKESLTCPGVKYRVVRMSVGRRIELTKRIRELGRKWEFLEAGAKLEDQIEAALLCQEIDRTYLEWGLVAVCGLRVDGEEATPDIVVSRGPEEFCREVVAGIKSECHLTEDERKN